MAQQVVLRGENDAALFCSGDAGRRATGCGAAARLCGFRGTDTLKVGVGMMTRGEVALIVAQRGLAEGMISSVYFTSVILLIIVSSIATPIILKLLFREKKPKQELSEA